MNLILSFMLCLITSVSVLSWALPAHAEDRPGQPVVATFTKPKINGKYVDWCRSPIGQCGRQAADAYCKSKGYVASQRYVKASDKTYNTRYISGGATCKNPFKCDWFYRISCTKPAAAQAPAGKTNPPRGDANGLVTKYFHWKQYASNPVDFCKSPTGKCGFATATAMCQRKGFQFANNYTKARSYTRNSRYIDTNQKCLNPAGCNWMYSVSCGSYTDTPELTRISANERALVIVVADLAGNFPTSNNFPQNLNPKYFLGNMYRFVEDQSVSIANKHLSRNYASVTTVVGRNATPASLVQALKRAAQPSGIKAVDLIFATHGTDQNVSFQPGVRASSSKIATDIQNALTGRERAKLRAVFSTACFGRTHNADWLNAGFKTVAGANQIYTDSAFSYEPMLAAWGRGRPFRSAITAANNADDRDVFDSAFDTAITNKWIPVFQEYAGKVDSTRVVAGEGRISINTMVTK